MLFRSQERCEEQTARTGATVHFTTDDPPGVECPEPTCVILGHSKKYKRHKGTLDFREMLRRMVWLEETERAKSDPLMTMTDSGQLNTNVKLSSRMHHCTQFIDKVVTEAEKNFTFCVYDTNNCWHQHISGSSELRTHISNSVREVRKSIKRTQIQTQDEVEANSTEIVQQQQRLRSRAMYSYDDNGSNNQDDSSMMGLDPQKWKRSKIDNSGSISIGCL